MYKLSPSDFAFLYEECKLCYYLKVKHKVYQPSMPMPGVFSSINSLIQGDMVGKSLNTLNANLPAGQVIKQEGWVDSQLIPGTSVFIKGKYDLLVKNKDGSHTLVDLKISKPHSGKVDKYQTQLAAYKFALENPKSGLGINISQMGLLIFYPDSVTFTNQSAQLDFPPQWLSVPDNQSQFKKFAKEIDQLLSGPMPEENPECKWCQYRHSGEQFSHPSPKPSTPVQQDIPF